MTHEELKPYLPPTREEYRQWQQESIDKIKASCAKRGSILESEGADGERYVMVYLATDGRRVRVTVERDGLFAGQYV